MKQLDRITPQSQDFAKWYTDVIKHASLMKYGPAKGTMILEPNGFAIWEAIQRKLDDKFKELGVQNVSFPMFFPEELLQKEKDHIEGFAPEVLRITEAGNEKLAKPLVIRPTSEPIFCHYFATKIDSYKDLPMILNQWCSVVRWEKTTNPFLRSTEFLWQEGHTCHETDEESNAMAEKMINVYKTFVEEYLAIPVITGQKTESEKFAGAKSTYTIESLMPNGYALQSGTSHNLSDNFAKTFGVKYQSKDQKSVNVCQSSWGVSTRLIGALIMSHADDKGLVLPPKIASVQIDVLELFAKKDESVHKAALKLRDLLKGKSVRIDESDKGPGFKAANSEIIGTPIRIEVGPRDLKNNQVMVVTRFDSQKTLLDIDKVNDFVDKKLEEIQKAMFTKAQDHLKSRTKQATSLEELEKFINEGCLVLVPFDGEEKDEDVIKEKMTATPRCICKEKTDNSKCISTGKETNRWVYFAKAY